MLLIPISTKFDFSSLPFEVYEKSSLLRHVPNPFCLYGLPKTESGCGRRNFYQQYRLWKYPHRQLLAPFQILLTLFRSILIEQTIFFGQNNSYWFSRAITFLASSMEIRHVHLNPKKEMTTNLEWQQQDQILLSWINIQCLSIVTQFSTSRNVWTLLEKRHASHSRT